MAVQFVVDNSVIMSWCFEDEKDRYATAVLDALDSGTARVPAIWPLEAGNVLLAAQRKKRIGEAAAIRFLELLQQLPIVVEQESPSRMLREIYSLAKLHGLSTYDSSYLDLSMRLGLPLATLDESLIQAARQCGIPLFDPSSGEELGRAGPPPAGP